MNVVTEVVLYGVVGVGASVFRDRFASRPGAERVLHDLAATTYLTLALLMLMEATTSIPA